MQLICHFTRIHTRPNTMMHIRMPGYKGKGTLNEGNLEPGRDVDGGVQEACYEMKMIDKSRPPGPDSRLRRWM